VGEVGIFFGTAHKKFLKKNLSFLKNCNNESILIILQEKSSPIYRQQGQAVNQAAAKSQKEIINAPYVKSQCMIIKHNAKNNDF